MSKELKEAKAKVEINNSMFAIRRRMAICSGILFVICAIYGLIYGDQDHVVKGAMACTTIIIVVYYITTLLHDSEGVVMEIIKSIKK